MADIQTIPNLFTKAKLSASDFRPFSLRTKVQTKRQKTPKLKETRLSPADRYSDDLNLFSLCSGDYGVSDDESSSSDESDNGSDEVASSRQPSSSSGKASGTSSEQRRVRFQCPTRNETRQDEKSDSSKLCVHNTTVDNEKMRKVVHTISRVEERVESRESTSSRAQILAKMRRELFQLPGDVQTATEESSEDENIMEASCGHSPTPISELTAQLPAMEDCVSLERIEEEISYSRSPRREKTHSTAKCGVSKYDSPVQKEHDECTKAKLVNCPVCGKVIIEKSLKLRDHYDDCHTPQRTDLNCLGYLPTHRHSDGTAFVRLGESERISGNQCFVCYRVCADARQLRLHWQLHKVYVTADDAVSAVDSESEDVNDLTDHCALEMSVEERESTFTSSALRDICPDPTEDDLWNSNTESTDDESESEIDRLRDDFEAYGMSTVAKLDCTDVSPRLKKRKRRKTPKAENAVEEKTECGRRCPDCDVVFRDPVLCSQHRLNDHGRKLMYRCVREECRKVFYHHRAYRDHHRGGHRQRAFICSQCNDHFSVYGQFLSHRRKHHRFLSHDHPFHCQKCLLRFPSKSLLDIHKRSQKLQALIKSESNESQALVPGHGKCLICMVNFDGYSEFERHISEHFRKTYHCLYSLCSVTRGSMREMRRHMTEHYNQSDSLTCPRCGHKSEDRPHHVHHCYCCTHRCAICNRNYFLEDELFEHFLKRHFWVNLVCPFCSEMIPSIIEFVNHQKEFHLAYHSFDVMNEARINVRLFTPDVVQHFPQLSQKYPDLADGFYGFVYITNYCHIPYWWKWPAERRDKKLRVNMSVLRAMSIQDGVQDGEFLGRETRVVKRALGDVPGPELVVTKTLCSEMKTEVKTECEFDEVDVGKPLSVDYETLHDTLACPNDEVTITGNGRKTGNGSKRGEKGNARKLTVKLGIVGKKKATERLKTPKKGKKK